MANALSQSIYANMKHRDFLLDGLLLQSDAPSISKWGAKLDRSAGIEGFHTLANRLSSQLFREAKAGTPFIASTLEQFHKVEQGKITPQEMLTRLKAQM